MDIQSSQGSQLIVKIFQYVVMGALNGTICHVQELERHLNPRHGFVNFVTDIVCDIPHYFSVL